MKRRVLLAALITLTLSISASATTPNLPLERIDRFIEERRILAGIPGISVVMVQDDQIVYSHGYGWANIKTKTPANTIAATIHLVCIHDLQIVFNQTFVVPSSLKRQRTVDG